MWAFYKLGGATSTVICMYTTRQINIQGGGLLSLVSQSTDRIRLILLFCRDWVFAGNIIVLKANFDSKISSFSSRCSDNIAGWRPGVIFYRRRRRCLCNYSLLRAFTLSRPNCLLFQFGKHTKIHFPLIFLQVQLPLSLLRAFPLRSVPTIARNVIHRRDNSGGGGGG